MNSVLKWHEVLEAFLCHSPKAVLAGVASFLIQNDTQDKTTVSMQGIYVWMVKYPILRLNSK